MSSRADDSGAVVLDHRVHGRRVVDGGADLRVGPLAHVPRAEAAVPGVRVGEDGPLRARRRLGEEEPVVPGLGEARVATTEDASTLASTATARDLPLLAHCSEEPGHEYPGKHGGLTPAALWHLLRDHPEVRVIAAHWGGGFPFYALMPEVRTALEAGRVLFDTAASPLLYEPRIFRVVADLVGSDLIAWGSDFPLRNQQADRAAVEAAVPDLEERAAILGGNATRFLGLTPPDPTP